MADAVRAVVELKFGETGVFRDGHVDPEFYDRHYRPEALSETQRRHMELWHRDG